MPKNQFTINEMKRAAATALLTVGVAGAFFGVHLFDAPPRAAEAEVTTAELGVPHRPAGGRRWRSSNAEQSLATVIYYGEPDLWGRNRATLEGAMTLFQMGDTFSSTELAGGTLRVTLTKDYLAGYLATPFLGSDEPIAFALENRPAPFVVGPVLTRAFAQEQLAQR